MDQLDLVGKLKIVILNHVHPINCVITDEVGKWAGVGVHAKSGSLYVRLGKGKAAQVLTISRST